MTPTEPAQSAEYALSDEDRMIVQKTTENVDAASRPRCIAIHKNMLGKAHTRREELLRELRAVDRVIAMRSASLVALNDGRVERRSRLDNRATNRRRS